MYLVAGLLGALGCGVGVRHCERKVLLAAGRLCNGYVLHDVLIDVDVLVGASQKVEW